MSTTLATKVLSIRSKQVRHKTRLSIRLTCVGSLSTIFRSYFIPGAKTALLVGAGSGNDAAGALRHGVRVTAVEIDPVIIALGRRYHPERPYESRAVSVIVDDARSFFARTQESYDVISFGLLDSHTTTTMTNTRLIITSTLAA